MHPRTHARRKRKKQLTQNQSQKPSQHHLYLQWKQGRPTLVLNDDDGDGDEEVLELKERLAAYNLESSPEQSAAIETEVFKVPARKKEPSKRTAAQKKPLATVTEIFSDDDDDDGNEVVDEDFELQAVDAPAIGKKGREKTGWECEGC